MRSVLVLFMGMFLMQAPAQAAGVNDLIDIIGGVIGNRPGHGPGHDGPREGVRCSAQDRGWEEHFGGHRSCGECMDRHGSCVETCEYSEWTCVVEGQRWGRRAEFEGYGYSDREAEREAYRNCEDRGARFCHRVSCHSQNRAERRECDRNDGGWGRHPGEPGRPGRPGGPGRGRH